ncbi:SDR family oxidoreductase [Lichenicoccus sp.]|uniref:SDR family oxidoreductase n=1 Tax=Lichenicoccus sp. TaxID=2781899 RepID=UPI003D0E833C
MTQPNREEFRGRTALVTGAGKGIGRVLVERLVARGAQVVALSRSAADLASLQAETGCRTIAADLADIDGTLAALRRDAPAIDLLVNNAGITHLAPFTETTQAAFEAVMAVNVIAPMRISQFVARRLIDAKQGGAIVNVSSIAADVGIVDHTAYCASKGALDAMTRVMAVELGPHGIRTNSVNPVVTLTPMAVLAWSDPVKAGPMRSRIPMGRFVQPQEVADAVCYLLGDGAAMINGVCLAVDGGFRAA